nr:hypothetical protein [Candidatus Sigynarchaeum springense]
MVEIVTPLEMRAVELDTGKLVKCKPKDVGEIIIANVQKLLELANTYGVKVVFKMGKEYCFKYKGNYFYSKE